MTGNDHEPPGLGTMARKVARTALGAFGNRAELLAVEWQEEKSRNIEMFVWAVGLLFFAIMVALLLTGTIIFLFPPELRLYAAGAFILLYLAGAVLAAMSLRSLLRHEPFSESIEQVKKDRVWFDSLK